MHGRYIAHKTLTLVTFLIVLAALGCGSYNPVSPSQENSNVPGVENPLFARLLPTSRGDMPYLGSAKTHMISAKEGGVASNGYFSVYIPPGALKEDTEISIEMPRFPEAVVRLGPHGIKFRRKVTLSLSLNSMDSDASDYNVLWYNENSGRWEDIGGYIEDKAIKADLDHFSDYGMEDKG